MRLPATPLQGRLLPGETPRVSLSLIASPGEFHGLEEDEKTAHTSVKKIITNFLASHLFS